MAGGDNIRITFIAGGLGKGGAEKQFLYMLRALQELNASVQVISLTQGEFYENALARLGFRPIYAGSKPVQRIVNLIQAVRAFQPHFLQASHFFASFYAGSVGRLLNIPSIGAVRSDLHLDLEGVGRMGRYLLGLPDVYLANSNNARENAHRLGLPKSRVHVLHNVINLDEFDRQYYASPANLLSPDSLYAITVARLVPVKRMERFLSALELARRQVPGLVGVIVGDGPATPELRALAEAIGLKPDQPQAGVRFLGERNDIPQLLSLSDLFVLTSDREGFPNVLLEAMAARLPIVTTPAGETPELITEGANGFLVPFDDIQVLADRLVTLAQSPALRNRFGTQGRRIVEQRFSYPRLKNNLIHTYREIARQVKSSSALSSLDAHFPRYEPIAPGAGQDSPLP